MIDTEITEVGFKINVCKCKKIHSHSNYTTNIAYSKKMYCKIVYIVKE